MSPRRRTVLAALGSVGAVGGIGLYWNRRRLRRRDQVDALEATREIAVPGVDEPLRVSPDHVDSSHARVVDQLEAVTASQGEIPRRGSGLADAREIIEENPPDEMTTHAQRRSALESYRDAAWSLGYAQGHQYDHIESGEPTLELRRAARELESALDDVETQYRGESLTRVVVRSGTVDHLVSHAIDDHDRATDLMSDTTRRNVVAWGKVEEGRMRLHDADWFGRTQEGPDRTDDLTARYERLRERTEADTDNVDWLYAENVETQGSRRWLDARLHTEPKKHLDLGRPALAVRQQARFAVVAATLDRLTEVPARADLNGLDARFVTDVSTLPETKQTAVDQVRAALDEVGSDPLGQHLLSEPVRLLERGDGHIDQLLSNVQSYDERQWFETQDQASIYYLEATADAEQIPEVVRLVRDGD